MQKEYSQMLEECLRLMQSGMSTEECLARFPGHADKLRPRLAVAERLSRVRPTDPPAGALERGRGRLMAALSQLGPPRAVQLLGSSFWFPMPLRQALAPLRHVSLPRQLAAAAATVFLMAGAVMGASAAGGDPGSFFPFRSITSSDESAEATPTATPENGDEVEDTDESGGDESDTNVDDDAEEVGGTDDEDSGDDGTVTPTPTPDDVDDETEDADDQADDAEDDDSTVTPTPTPDDDADDETDDDDDSTVTPRPTSTPDDDDTDEGDEHIEAASADDDSDHDTDDDSDEADHDFDDDTDDDHVDGDHADDDSDDGEGDEDGTVTPTPTPGE